MEHTFAIMFRITTGIIFLFSLSIFISCDDSDIPEGINTEEIAEEAIEDFENYRLKLNLEDSAVLEFPTPVEIATSYKKSGMRYIPGITNPSRNFITYETHTKKALNFGVYSADLSYCVVNEIGQCASEYLLAMQSLSNDIGLSEILKYEVVVTSFNNSLGNTDSLTHLVSDIQSDLDATLRKNGIQERAILFYTGAWIESAYLAFNSQATYSNSIDSATLVQIYKQMEMLEQINVELAALEYKTMEVSDLEKSLNEFEDLSNSIRFVKREDSIILNPSDLAKIRFQVENIRKKIIS